MRPSRTDIDRFIVLLSWAAAPTVILVLVTAVKPVYFPPYVTESAPGMAIVLALLVTHAVPSFKTPPSVRRRAASGGAVIVGLVILVVNSVAVVTTTSEDLRGATQYIVRHASPPSEVAIPGHFLTAGVEYYLVRDLSRLRLWPQQASGRFNDGLVLLETERTFAVAPKSVWLVDDGSVKGAGGFISSLEKHGFIQVNVKTFYGSVRVRVLHFLRRSGVS